MTDFLQTQPDLGLSRRKRTLCAAFDRWATLDRGFACARQYLGEPLGDRRKKNSLRLLDVTKNYKRHSRPWFLRSWFAERARKFEFTAATAALANEQHTRRAKEKLSRAQAHAAHHALPSGLDEQTRQILIAARINDSRTRRGKQPLDADQVAALIAQKSKPAPSHHVPHYSFAQ
ncbi:MAG: hypothetical protein H6865_03545 [Rhodospirillales bacterium]|nr:hypothetical protein [Alphaproteobacteria bacterium]MCB9986691.1 hypothetical protein [Rhodospirillales bacterium]USO06784.1 MAG: hypothetical protein H6866_04840 [Rhodospirillales bacterium]